MIKVEVVSGQMMKRSYFTSIVLFLPNVPTTTREPLLHFLWTEMRSCLNGRRGPLVISNSTVTGNREKSEVKTAGILPII